MKIYYYGFIISLCLILGVVIGQQNPIESGFIDVPDGKLYYEMTGQGDETIIFIHDGLVHGAVWDGQFSVFAEKYRVVRYDRRGYGNSPKPEKSYSGIEDLNSVFNHLKIEKAILMGMSAGGALTIDFTVEYPDKVSSIILVGAIVGGFTYSDHMTTRGGRLKASDYADREKLMKYIIKEDPYEIAPQNKDIREKLWTLMQAYPHNVDSEKNRLEAIPEKKGINFLNEIQVPALLVLGEFDIPDVFVHAGAIESGMPFAQRVIIQNAGHLVPYEQPDIFNEKVLNFLNGAEFNKILKTKGVAEAVAMFTATRKKDDTWIPFSEAEMNVLGYRHLREGKLQEAIELFKLNVAAYPESANTYDSLGEAYMKQNDTELAIKNYKRSLELDPDNKNAIQMLEQLQ